MQQKRKRRRGKGPRGHTPDTMKGYYAMIKSTREIERSIKKTGDEREVLREYTKQQEGRRGRCPNFYTLSAIKRE